MTKSKGDITTRQSSVQCVEVLISKNYLTSSHSNLSWILSVYSLENRPVRGDRHVHEYEIFHFMVYDWNKTIRELLERHQVAYSIVQLFTPATIFADPMSGQVSAPDNEQMILAALGHIGGDRSSEKRMTAADAELLQ